MHISLKHPSDTAVLFKPYLIIIFYQTLDTVFIVKRISIDILTGFLQAGSQDLNVFRQVS